MPHTAVLLLPIDLQDRRPSEPHCSPFHQQYYKNYHHCQLNYAKSAFAQHDSLQTLGTWQRSTQPLQQENCWLSLQLCSAVRQSKFGS